MFSYQEDWMSARPIALPSTASIQPLQLTVCGDQEGIPVRIESVASSELLMFETAKIHAIRRTFSLKGWNANYAACDMQSLPMIGDARR